MLFLGKLCTRAWRASHSCIVCATWTALVFWVCECTCVFVSLCAHAYVSASAWTCCCICIWIVVLLWGVCVEVTLSIPSVEVVFPECKQKYCYFARFFMEGRVLPIIKTFEVSLLYSWWRYILVRSLLGHSIRFSTLLYHVLFWICILPLTSSLYFFFFCQFLAFFSMISLETCV